MDEYKSAFNPKDYDRKIASTLPYYEDFYKQVSDVLHCHFNSNLSWLDLGCGTGKMAEIAFRDFDIERFVFCDISEDMVNIAKSRFGSTNSEFLVSSAQNIKFSEEFDVVTSIMVNHYLSKNERLIAIQNAYNSLKESGVFISFENFAPFTQLGEKIYLERWKHFQIENGKSTEEAETHISRYNKNYFPITISEHLETMKICGFNATEILWLSNMQIGILGIKQWRFI